MALSAGFALEDTTSEFLGQDDEVGLGFSCGFIDNKGRRDMMVYPSSY